MEPRFLLAVICLIVFTVGFSILYSKAREVSADKHWIEMFEHQLCGQSRVRGVRRTNREDVVEVDLDDEEGWHAVKVNTDRGPIAEANRVARLLA